MSTATALADTLPSSIPKLEATSLNWAIFSLHFQDAVEAKGYWGHFNGTTPWPDQIITYPEDSRLGSDENLQGETMKKWWDIITKFTKKGTFAQTDLCTHFLELKCPEKGNVCQFLDDLRIKREELSMIGVDIQ